MLKTRFWGKDKSRNPECWPPPGHLPSSWRCRGTGTSPGRAGGPAVPGPTAQTSSFQGKAGKGTPRDWGAPTGRPCPLPPSCLPPGRSSGAPGWREICVGSGAPESLPRGTAAGKTPPGSPAEPRWWVAGWGQTDRGQMTNSVLSRFPMPILPTRAALPRPAPSRRLSRGTRLGGDLAVPRSRAGRSVGTAVPGRGIGGHGTAEPGIQGFTAGAG